jgi:hypothetical protein
MQIVHVVFDLLALIFVGATLYLIYSYITDQDWIEARRRTVFCLLLRA